ncbi:thiamine pyrophosphate-dependent enzyme [Arhodomonas sp. AD133]|uniref:thiamine pyrophosphate-dependent enzyme n=1 Tax=Arhodomonas sp. AD133 TaxID=3415009 RepID=UPI003EB79D83
MVAAGAKAGRGGASRMEAVDERFRTFVRAWEGEAMPETLPRSALCELFDSQMLSRHLDFEARHMRARNEGFYTIGSAGHEGNAAVARALRASDPAFLHYRSGAFMMERARQLPDVDAVYDTALSLAASAEDPIAGGRHKVWGSRAMWVVPQTSTIASHLPKAVGTALAIGQHRRDDPPLPVPDDALAVCSFGDASVNHAAALAGFNTAAWSAFQHLPCPVLFVCEDNGLGISVATPPAWIRESFRARPGIRYFEADGLDVAEAYRVAREAAEYVRRTRMPAFLHLHVVRLLGHAGSDVEATYRPAAAIEADESRDPLLRSAALAMATGALTPEAVLERYEAARARVADAARRAAARPRLASREAVMAPLEAGDPEAVAAEACRRADDEARAAAFGGHDRLPERQPPRHLAVQINRALHDLMVTYPQARIFGEDVARKGGVYTVTAGLHRAFGPRRVFNTLLDETAILGLAQGAGLMGLMPIPEIQYLAYLHNALDQLRGEACSLGFFSGRQFANPMTVRIAGLAYQKGFGGHFHNDNSITALRDIPGLVIACPSRGDDAVGMLRTALAMNRVDGAVVAYLEPIALYMTKDLHENGDGGWCFDYPPPGEAVPMGEGRVYHDHASDLLVITYGNGVWMSLRVAERLDAAVRVLDLRWLKPLNAAQIVEHARATGRVLVVDEGRRTGGLVEEIFTLLDEYCGEGMRKARVSGADSYIPLAEAAYTVLPGEGEIEQAARRLLE